MSTPENSNTKGCLPAPYYNPGDSLEDVIDRLPLPYEVIDHADEVPGSQLPGYSPIFRNRLSKNGLINSFHPQVTTCYDIFRTTVVSYPKLGFLGFRELDPTTGTYSTNYKYISYEKGYQIVKELGAGIKYLLNEYYCPSEKTKDAIISIYLPNCYQFPLIDLATQSQSIVNTCLYDTLGESALVYILELTETPIIFTDKSKLPLFFKLKQNHLRNLQQNQRKAKLNFLKIIITNETLDLSTNHELFEEAHKANIFLIDLRTVQNIGRQNPAREVLPTRKTLFTISFTSGTTGVPKGAVLTHANAVSSIVAGLSFAGTARGIPLHKRHMFALLPLAHIYERSILYSTIFVATTVCFPHKPTEPATFFDDIKLVRPVDLVGVPRVLIRVEDNPKLATNARKYNELNFPTWTYKVRDGAMGGLYGFPLRNGYLKIGYRGLKWTNPQGKINSKTKTKYTEEQSETNVPIFGLNVIKNFIRENIPEVERISMTRLCWYSDSEDNDFLISYCPYYESKSLFVGAGDSGHAFMMFGSLGNVIRDILFEKSGGSTDLDFLTQLFSWKREREKLNLINQGVDDPRALCHLKMAIPKDWIINPGKL